VIAGRLIGLGKLPAFNYIRAQSPAQRRGRETG